MVRAALIAAGISLLLSVQIPAQAAVPELQQPTWAELNPQQKQILAPLAPEWDKLEGFRRKKWMGIAARYPSMTPDEQARIQQNMKYWINLSPDERKKARERYKSLQKAPPEQRQAIKQKWEQYKELPDDEKKRLAEKAAQRSTPKTLSHKPASKTGAAAPLKPAAPSVGTGAPGGATVYAPTNTPSNAQTAPTPVAPSAAPAK